MSSEITEDQLIKLAHNMVAAGNLNVLYGVEPFIKAQKAFEETLRTFVHQSNERRPAPLPHEEINIDLGESTIPEFLQMKIKNIPVGK